MNTFHGILAFLFLSGLVFGTTGCGAGEQDPTKTDTKKQDEPKKDAPKTDAPKKEPAKPTNILKEIDDFIAEKKIDTKATDWKLKLPKPPMAKFDSSLTWHWTLETTKGTIKVKLLPEAAPMHASSTIYLTKLGFYDGIIFHRVIPGFMAQGGDPTGTGSGGPGYKYDGEFLKPEIKHSKAGMLSMAHAGPGTDGSQFFLTFGPTPHLDMKHTIFGEVVEGMDALRGLQASGSPSGKTSEKLEIKKATVSAN